MRLILQVILFLHCGFLILGAQDGFSSYHEDSELLLAPPGALRYGLYGFTNPAAAALFGSKVPDLLFTWQGGHDINSMPNRWGAFFGARNLGFGVVERRFDEDGSLLPGRKVTDYRIASSFGTDIIAFGSTFGWSTGDDGLLGRGNILRYGVLHRPLPWLTFGGHATITTSGPNAQQIVGELALRPLMDERLTIFGDFALRDGQRIGDAAWSAGLVAEPLPGFRLSGRYFDTEAFSLGLGVSFGHLGFESQAHFDADQDHAFNTYAVRLGAYDRTTLGKLIPVRKYVELSLLGGIKYQRNRFFDDSKTLYDLLRMIEIATEDPSVAGMVINASGAAIGREMLWELRQALQEFRAAGKRVLIFIDRAGMNEYHFASVADRVVLDPVGGIALPGFRAGRTYYKHTLAKIGVGFQELRYLKYKSALESFARDEMSEADREQRQAIVDDFYAIAREEICAVRPLSYERFDSLVNKVTVFMPADALRHDLVDTLARWEGLKHMVTALEGGPVRYVSPSSLEEYHLPDDDRWGRRPRIAIIYALGICAMDQGIKARSLVNYVEAAADDDNIKAVVLRVDSPGGDAMASDIVAEALRECARRKPVIVSQGSVAASGGYWLSMYADAIVAAPMTVTGSIGVIGGWAYDNGLKDKLGFSTDVVSRGDNAALGFGFSVLGLGVPDSSLNKEQLARVQRSFSGLYENFVAKVAEGRDTSAAAIEAVAQGRVWTGRDGLANGLVDEIGGLQSAIRIAMRKAGLSDRNDIRIIQWPTPPLFNLPALFGLGSGAEEPLVQEQLLEHLRFLLEHNGEAMPVLPDAFVELVE